MNESRIDTISRYLASSRPRRTVLRGIVGSAAALAGIRSVSAEQNRPCSGNHLECPGKQLCMFDDATEQLFCRHLEDIDHSSGQICKGEFEFTYCQRGSKCCVYPGIRDPGGISLVTNCCDGEMICDTQLGCVPRPSA